jgi:hypothetical protein
LTHNSSAAGFKQARADLSIRLRARRHEIEQAVLTRIYSIADPTEVDDPGYLYGLRAAVSMAIDYVLASIEQSEEHGPPIPVAVLAQARLAARNAVDVGAVLRRFSAAWAVLDDFLLDEADQDERLSGADIKRLIRS